MRDDQALMDEFFETRSFDVTKDWRTCPATFEDPESVQSSAFASVLKFNPNHHPAGSSQGGEFAPKAAAAWSVHKDVYTKQHDPAAQALMRAWLDSDEKTRDPALEEQVMATLAENRRLRGEWDRQAQEAISLGQLSPQEAQELGWWGSNAGSADQYKPLPPVLYHVTTAASDVEAGGLKTRLELAMGSGLGLGGGADDTISFTTDKGIADEIQSTMHLARDYMAGDITQSDLVQQARDGKWLDRMGVFYGGTWEKFPGTDLHPSIYDALNNTRTQMMGAGYTQAMLDGGWGGKKDKGDRIVATTDKNVWVQRPATEEEAQDAKGWLLKRWLAARESITGKLDPLFFSSNLKALGKVSKDQIKLMQFEPNDKAMGYEVSSMGEWRTHTGKAVKRIKTHKFDHIFKFNRHHAPAGSIIGGQFIGGPREEIDGGSPPAPGTAFIVYRLASSQAKSLDNTNAGNAMGVAEHLARIDDFDAPAFAGGSGDTIHAYRVTVAKPFGGYHTFVTGGGNTDTTVGRQAGKSHNIIYSFPKGSEYTQEHVASVSLQEVRDLLKAQGYSSFDDSGWAAGGEAIREAFSRRKVRKFNPLHMPAGTSEGGQFAPATMPAVTFGEQHSTLWNHLGYSNFVGGEVTSSDFSLLAGRAKDHVANALANRLLDAPEVVQRDIIAMAQVVMKHDMNAINLITSTPKGKLALYTSACSSLVANWAASASDHNALAHVIQRAVQEEFDLPKSTLNALKGQVDSTERAMGFDMAVQEEMYRFNNSLLGGNGWRGLKAFVRAQYEETQDFFRKAGITEVILTRGMALKDTKGLEFEKYALSSKHEYTMNGEPIGKPALFEAEIAFGIANVKSMPQSSWSYQDGVAASFSSVNRGRNVSAVLISTIPVRDIMSTNVTGVGCLNECEMTVLGRTRKAKFMAVKDETGRGGWHRVLNEMGFSYSGDSSSREKTGQMLFAWNDLVSGRRRRLSQKLREEHLKVSP